MESVLAASNISQFRLAGIPNAGSLPSLCSPRCIQSMLNKVPMVGQRIVSNGGEMPKALPIAVASGIRESGIAVGRAKECGMVV